MKIITVCEKAIGTSILLKMNTDKALDQLGLDGDVEAADIGSAKGAASPADLVLTSAETAPKFDGLSTPVRVIDDFMDVDEISAAITDDPQPLTAARRPCGATGAGAWRLRASRTPGTRRIRVVAVTRLGHSGVFAGQRLASG